MCVLQSVAAAISQPRQTGKKWKYDTLGAYVEKQEHPLSYS